MNMAVNNLFFSRLPISGISFNRISVMKLKWVFGIILTTLPVLLTQTSVQAANSSQIDIVRTKKVLDDQDKKFIDDYLGTAVDILINERNFTNIARDREAILTRKGGTQAQYVLQFNESIGKYLTDAFEKVKNLRPMNRQAIIVANLLILINGLEDVQFAVLPMQKLEDNNVIVRYWAVQCLTNPIVIEQLNSKQAKNPNLAQEITGKFVNMVPKSGPEILNLIARYAGTINIPDGQKLLLQIADQRIKSYSEWAARDALIDGNILKLLENKISDPPENTDVSALAQRFAQLYSYVIQRYAATKDTLSESQKAKLVTVIVETENKCISNMLGPQQNMLKAIQDDQMSALMAEAGKLFGTVASQGQLSAKYGFNYGRNETGTVQTAPMTLPPRPR
jgi:hypothetical protein